MAKSKGNFYTVYELVTDKGLDPLAIRYALISGVYGKPLNFTDQSLRDATQNIDRFKAAEAAIQSALANDAQGENTLAPVLDDLYDQALDAMCNDLNTAVALAKALEGARTITRESTLSRTDAEAGRRFLDRINALLGIVCHDAGPACGLPAVAPPPKVDEAYIQSKIDKRAALKKAKDFAGADAIRAELDSQGIELRDTPEGTFWKQKAPI